MLKKILICIIVLLSIIASTLSYTEEQKHPYGEDWIKNEQISTEEEGFAEGSGCTHTCQSSITDEISLPTESYCTYSVWWGENRCDDDCNVKIGSTMIFQDTGCCCSGPPDCSACEDESVQESVCVGDPTSPNAVAECGSGYTYKAEERECGDITPLVLIGEPTIVTMEVIDKCGECRSGPYWWKVRRTDDGDINQECCAELKGDLNIFENTTWTGTVCCQPPPIYSGIEGKYYKNDNHLGCWNGIVLKSGEFPLEDNSTIYFKDDYYGCQVDEEILSLKEYYTQEQLVNQKEVCDKLEDNSYFCSYTKSWRPLRQDLIESELHLSIVPWETTFQKGECCAITDCWNGTHCVESQADNPTSTPNNESYRCIDGKWDSAYIVEEPERPNSLPKIGYCPNAGQCLWNVLGDAEDNSNTSGNPQCIDSGQYIEDYYCEDGEWSSRTKWLAVEMLSLRGSDYKLLCGGYADLLNFIDYNLGLTTVRNLIKDNENNYCILDSDDKVIIGTTMNNGLDENYMQVLGIDSCNIDDDGEFHACNSNNNVWYNKKTQTVMFSRTPFQMPNIDTSSIFDSQINIPFNNLISKLSSSIESPYDPDFFLEGINNYRVLFFNKKGKKLIFGAMEGLQYKNVAVEFVGFETDICSLINQFGTYYNTDFGGIKCSKAGTTYYILSQGSILTNTNPENIWLDLTAKVNFQ